MLKRNLVMVTALGILTTACCATLKKEDKDLLIKASLDASEAKSIAGDAIFLATDAVAKSDKAIQKSDRMFKQFQKK